MQISDAILPRLVEIVGESHIVTDPDRTARYAIDQSFTEGKAPHCVVFPERASEIQAIVKLANELRVPVVPRSSPVSLHGAGIPAEKGIIVDLKRMNRILEINDRNWYAIIEPGVTFGQLNNEVQSHGFRLAKPFLDPPSASVVSTYLERNPVVTAADFTYGSEHVISYTVVSPSGETFTVGHPPLENTPASAPDGPGLNFYRIFQGAQGTLGIVTWMIIRLLPIPKKRKVFFLPSANIEGTIEITRKIQKYELGLECLAMNAFNWSALSLEEIEGQGELLKQGSYIANRGAVPWDESQIRQFNDLRQAAPPWLMAICLSAVGPIPDEKIAYQENDLRDVAGKIGAEPKTQLEGLESLNRLVLDELFLSWRMQKRFGYKGSCRQIMFFSPPDRVVKFQKIIWQICREHQYPSDDIGFYLLPFERARAFYCSVDLHLDPEDPDDSLRINTLYDHLSENLIEKGAFFDRPYGKWAESVYGRSATYAQYLKKIKGAIDPNNIMNPGKLCFG